MSMLSNRKIVLGVGGGIAAYKSAELVRLLGKAGAEVHVVLSEGGARFVTPVTYQALSGNPVWSDLWDARMPNHMAHIDLGRDADAIARALDAGGVAVPQQRCTTLEEAVRWSFERARAGDAVLLSPACASLDMFRNYGHRAQVFVQAVQSIAADRGEALA